MAAPAILRRLWGSPEQYILIRWLFLRLLGIIYLATFLSLWSQLAGLIGSHGILPAADFLQAVQAQTGPERYWLLPTLFWLNTSDTALHLVCGGGVFLSLLLILDVMPGPVLFLLWLFYLSLTLAGQDFLAFQWDNLLLETGFLALLFAPWSMRLRPGLAYRSPPSLAGLWLLRWLLFRLMFGSGVVKLLSGDPTWRNLTALEYHYETQPLPPWTAWYMHQLPAWFQRLSAVAMFGIELGVPFLIFGPRRLRLAAAGLLAALQVLIIATGNFAFFNWLSLVLCLVLLDDAFLRRWLPGQSTLRKYFLPWLRGGWRITTIPLGSGYRDVPQPAHPTWTSRLRFRQFLIAGLAGLLLLLSSLQFLRMFLPLPGPASRVLAWVAPLRTINTYGLFAVMTTSRPEIIIEGSNDGETWQPYEFKWKPGDPQRRPDFVAPHQPRLDWQMWFAALSVPSVPSWFINFLERLQEGSPEVLALLGNNPFPDRPPRYLRALIYDYHFTNFASAGSEGAWWRRELRGTYPILSPAAR